MTISHHCGGQFEKLKWLKLYECTKCDTDALIEEHHGLLCIFERPRDWDRMHKQRRRRAVSDDVKRELSSLAQELVTNAHPPRAT